MARWLSFALFFVVALVVITLWHYYLWLRLVRDPAWSPPVARGLTWLLIGLGLALPLGLVLARVLPPTLSRAIAWFAFVWMGGGFILLVLVAAGDLFTQVLVKVMSLSAQGPKAGPADPERRIVLARTLAAGTGLLAASTTIYGVRGALSDVQVQDVEVKLARLPKALSGMTVVQLTDVHVGSMIGQVFVQGLVDRIQGLRPDVVVITGDLVDGPVARLGKAVAPLGLLTPRWGTYFVTGNHEYYSNVGPWMKYLSGLGIQVLENRRVAVGESAGPQIDLVGLPDPTSIRMGSVVPDLGKALVGRDEDRELILLAHQPKAISEAVPAGVGLQLSGHTHGGQIWPFGALVALTQPYLSGLHRREDTQIYVSRGTGFWGPPMRVGAPAEITRLVLVPA